MDHIDILNILKLDDANIDSILDKLVILNIALVDVYAFAVQNKVSAALAARVLVVNGLLATANSNPLIDPRWTRQQVTLIKHYTSGSGNATWKCSLAAGGEVYIRQVNKQIWLEAGYAVNEMALNDEWPADITIYTADGEKGFLDVKHVESNGTLTKPASLKPDLVQELAREWISPSPMHYILDTETTGKESGDEVVQLSIIDTTGKIVFDTLVKPTRPISASATAIHGITDDMVTNAPAIHTLTVDGIPLRDWLVANEDTIITYNAAFDGRLLCQSFKVQGVNPDDDCSSGFVFNCAMTLYSEHNGDWNELKQDFKWVSLVNACAAMGVTFIGTAHSAIGDAQATLELIKALADAGPRLPF